MVKGLDIGRFRYRLQHNYDTEIIQFTLSDTNIVVKF